MISLTPPRWKGKISDSRWSTLPSQKQSAKYELDFWYNVSPVKSDMGYIQMEGMSRCTFLKSLNLAVFC